MFHNFLAHETGLFCESIQSARDAVNGLILLLHHHLECKLCETLGSSMTIVNAPAALLSTKRPDDLRVADSQYLDGMVVLMRVWTKKLALRILLLSCSGLAG